MQLIFVRETLLYLCTLRFSYDFQRVCFFSRIKKMCYRLHGNDMSKELNKNRNFLNNQMELIAKKSKDQYRRENKWDRHECKRKMHSW